MGIARSPEFGVSRDGATGLGCQVTGDVTVNPEAQTRRGAESSSLAAESQAEF